MSDSRMSVVGIIAGIAALAVVAVVAYQIGAGGKDEAPGPEPGKPVVEAAAEPEKPMAVEDVAAVEVQAPVEEAAAPEPEPEEPASNPNRERGERIAQAQMKLLADMVYKPFYDEVALDADTKAAASDLFVDFFAAQQKVQQEAMMKGDRTASEIKAETDALRDQLRGKLEGVFNESQLASWEGYDAYSDRILFEALLDGQLRMLAPDLSIESHEASMALMAEELALSIERFEESSESYNMDNFNDAQLEGLNTAVERLKLELDAEQIGHAQGFVDQVKVMFDAMKTPPAQ